MHVVMVILTTTWSRRLQGTRASRPFNALLGCDNHDYSVPSPDPTDDNTQDGDGDGYNFA